MPLSWAYEGLRGDLLESLGDLERDTFGVRTYLEYHGPAGLQGSAQIRVNRQHCRIQMTIQQGKNRWSTRKACRQPSSRTTELPGQLAPPP
eukprot:1806168-Pyramimonas_sp.AAC.1